MKKGGTDFNANAKRTTCQWCSVPKQKTVPPLLLCPVHDQGPLLIGERKLLDGEG